MVRHALALMIIASALVTPMSSTLAQGTGETVAQTGQTPLEMRADQIVALVNAELDIPYEDLFGTTFITEIPAGQLSSMNAQFISQFGPALAVENLSNPAGPQSSFVIRFERAVAKGIISISPSDGNRINGLRFTSFSPIDDNAAKIIADIAALPGTASVYFGPVDGGAPVIDIAAETQAPIASAFKLYVLAALAAEVRSGKRSWGDVVTLNTQSFPSGVMQDWPESSPVTLHTLATMMISISDNTATDQLIDTLGRRTIEKTLIKSGHSVPHLNIPLLRTRELFQLKGGSRPRLEAYRSGNADARSAILESIESEPVGQENINAAFSVGPVALDVEWFANAADFANLFRYMRATADPEAFAILGINPSMSDETQQLWGNVGYKGGSEPGVLNFTYFLTDKADRDHILVMSISNPDASIQETAFTTIAQRILSLPQ